MKKRIQILLIFLVVIIGIGIVSTNQAFAADDYTISIQPISYTAQPNVLTRSSPVPSVVADHENVQMEKSCYTGETFALTAIIVPPNAYVGEVIWTIEQDTEIAKIVSQNGLTATIVGVKAGTCKIICSAADGQGAYTTCLLNVYQKAQEVVLLPHELVLEPGDTQQLIATVLPEDTTDKTLHWESSDEEIVTVDSDGVVTAVKASDKPVKVTVTVMDGSNVSAASTVYVRVMAQSLEWVKFSNVIYKNGNNTETFAVKVNPDHTTVPTVKYSTSDPSVATVIADSNDNMQVIITPKKPGKFILTCETTDGSNLKLSAEVEVVQLVEHISLNTTEKILFLEDGKVVTYQLIATALPANATILGQTDRFIWKSSDDSIATVDNKGLVTAVFPGTTTITVTANDVGAVTAQCIIHVRKAVTKIDIDLYTFEYIANSATNGIKLLEQLKYLNGVAFMYSGNEVALNAKFNADATTTTLMWQIPGIAKDANGNNVIGVFGKLSNAYTNPTILTAMPINNGNENGYLTITINCKATDGSGVTSQRVVQIRQPATSVEFSTTDMTLYMPDSGMSPNSAKIIPTILPENAYINKNPDDFTDGQIEWVSSDETVATVDEFGRVTAVGPGEATIIGTVADGQGAVNKCTVTVIQPVQSLSVYAYQDTVKVPLDDYNAEEADSLAYRVFAYTNQEIRLYTDVFPENATNSKLTWYSSDPELVTVENGFLKIGSKANTTIDENGIIDGTPVVIRIATTDGSGISFALNLCILDAGYNVELEETVSINAGDTDKLLLKVFKTQTLGDKLITSPVPVNTTITLSGDKIGTGDDQLTVMELFDANGSQINSGHVLTNVTNPSFDIKGVGNGLATVTFNVELNEIGKNLVGKVLIGKTVSFERTCVVNVVGTENRHIAMENDTLTVLVGQRKVVTTIVTPNNAINYYVKYSLEPVNDDYPNPYHYARIDADSGVIDGIAVGQVKVVATLYDTDTGMPIKYGDEEERCEAIAYISASLTGVQMKDSVVYVGESLNLLDCTTVLPEVLDDTLALSGLKSSVLKFEVLAGDECIRFTSDAGTITGINHGTVRIRAVATYQTAVYTSPEVTISVRERLTNITLTDELFLKINQVVELTPIVTPLMADTIHVETTWSSSKIGIVTAEGKKSTNNLTGIITAKAEGKATVTISIKLPDTETPLTASCKVTVIGMYADDFSSLDPGEKYFTLGSSYTPYYRWGAYRMIDAQDKTGGTWYAAGCMENGAFSMHTANLYNSGETTVYATGNYTRYYPSMFPLKTFAPLERVEEIMWKTAEAGGFFNENDSATEKKAGFDRFMEEMRIALYTSAQFIGRPDEDAYLDLPDKSHVLTRSGNTYRTKDFLRWGYQGQEAWIFTGLSTQWESISYGAAGATLDAGQVVDDVSQYYSKTDLSYSGSRAYRFTNSYFTSALTALNTVAGSGEIATRQALGISIVQTYFPLDKMHGHSNYELYHTTRQMLMWAVSGIQTNPGYAKKLDQDYVFDTPHYTGYNMKYVIYMLQAKSAGSENSENYMEFPHGYSSFYYACSSIVAAGRFSNVNTMMTLVKGFIWKLDQVKEKTIPSFASPAAHADNANGAHFDTNLVNMVWSSADNAYVARLCDENGVLNYFNFEFVTNIKPRKTLDGVTFTNNGDGTLTVKITKEAKDWMENNNQYSSLEPAVPTYLPEDCKYPCATFTKWECESEIIQMPYTKLDGSLGYAYLMGQNAQSQTISWEKAPVSLGDPIYAHIAFKFEEETEYESMVESQVQLLDSTGTVVEYVIPGEQYQIQYTYTYIGDSRGLTFVNENPSGKTVDTSIYGFASDLRARKTTSDTLKELIATGNNGAEYIKSNSTVTSTDAVWGLTVDGTPVSIKGTFIIYNTPYGGIDGENAYSTYEFDWSHNLKIDGRDDGLKAADIRGSAKDSSGKSYSANITDITKLDGGDKVRIEWTFYSGWITLSSPYIKASADISIGQDSSHGVATQYNTSSDAAKYMYGLTIDGVQAVTSSSAASNGTANRPSEYVDKYTFTGVADNVVQAANRENPTVPIGQLAFTMFDGAPYSIARPDEDDPSAMLYIPFSQMSITDIVSRGATGSSDQIGDIAVFEKDGTLVGVAVNIGKPESGYNGYFFASWDKDTEEFIIAKWDTVVTLMTGYNNVKWLNFDAYIPDFAGDANESDGEGLVNVGSSATLKNGEGIKTSMNDKSRWGAMKNNLSKFTMTNHQTYGGAGYFNADFESIVSSNAVNPTWFHTDKTWQTVFDLSVSNLVVNTGAGITSPTLAETRSYVNLNIYYTLELDNSAYKMIVNRYGQVGSAWRMYYKFPSATSATLANAESSFYFRKQDFYYIDNGVKTWCGKNEAAKDNVTYYYVNTDALEAEHRVFDVRVSGSTLYYKETNSANAPEKSDTITNFYYMQDGQKIWCTSGMSVDGLSGFTHVVNGYVYTDSKSAASSTRGDFIPDDMENLLIGTGGDTYTRPAGYSEEKPCEETIHTDVFVDFSIYDNALVTDASKRMQSEFVNMTSAQQLDILKDLPSECRTGVVFIDNIQTGKNYIQHSLPYVFNNIESGLKVFGYSAHVNTTHNGASILTTNGGNVYVNRALCEWGRYVGPHTKFEVDRSWVKNSAFNIGHGSTNGTGDPTTLLGVGSSKLGHRVNIRNIDVLLSTDFNISNKPGSEYSHKRFFYGTEYAESYDNNAAATGMLQYPAYNPFTLSTISPNGSLIYKNGAGVEGFDMVLGNNKTLHVPNTDVVSYNVFDRNFGTSGKNNAALLTNKNLVVSNDYTFHNQYQGNSPSVNNASVHDFQFKSLAFYKYSNTNYTLMSGTTGAKPSSFLPVSSVPAATEIRKDSQTESYKITQILFRSTYTVSRKLGDNGWVDITDGSNPDALVNAGKGFELKIQVTYSNNNLTEYLNRYGRDSAQLGTLSSAMSGVTSTHCNISPLTGQYGTKSMIDAYTAKYTLGDGTEVWNDVFGANLYKDIYVVMNNNNKYVYSYSGIYGTNNVFDVATEYEYSDTSSAGKIVLTYTMRLSPVNGYFGNTDMNENDVSGLATQNMKFYTDAAASGTVGSLTIWTNPLVATPFDYPNTMKDRYLADLKQIQYFIVQPSDNVDNIVQ